MQEEDIQKILSFKMTPWYHLIQFHVKWEQRETWSRSNWTLPSTVTSLLSRVPNCLQLQKHQSVNFSTSYKACNSIECSLDNIQHKWTWNFGCRHKFFFFGNYILYIIILSNYYKGEYSIYRVSNNSKRKNSVITKSIIPYNWENITENMIFPSYFFHKNLHRKIVWEKASFRGQETLNWQKMLPSKRKDCVQVSYVGCKKLQQGFLIIPIPCYTSFFTVMVSVDKVFKMKNSHNSHCTNKCSRPSKRDEKKNNFKSK